MAPSSSVKRQSLLNLEDGWAPDGTRVPRMRDVKPASLSMFESTLDQNSWKLPAIGKLQHIEASLKRDHMKLNETYHGVAPNDASGSVARFNIKLPASPQHLKYCHPKTLAHSHTASESSSPRSPHKDTIYTKFSMPHLERIFKHLAEGTDVIAHRKFIVAIQSSEDLLETFRRFALIPQAPDHEKPRDSPDHKRSRGSVVAAGDREAGEKHPRRSFFQEDAAPEPHHVPHTAPHKEELGKMKQILVDLDEDGSGQMEWDEFVEFFRRAGLLMEYQTRKSLNHTDMDDVIEPIRERQRQEKLKFEERLAQHRPNLYLDDKDEVQKSALQKVAAMGEDTGPERLQEG
mmetsp:Transcript_16546/g.28932  ORF Transcript_16546/g.28932 Transcript_16546/m.28932 type:complete len:346 (+) Transcript_16546:50-1087(+)|eukprot:CAMPEP_0197664646 /NCGR_PEP_ID=MMETSP1338-20131121/58767_1 /TAXON_ID=43686 ORGANISM="Pelagodinium beii, Strain RCC1491" /NCGR_SAMPLE_ID=MMETSP1338 /ASSEMBLY_ACC=CAM_ASM_000754 /LENGTH=345 /DNA_ID=CAMNT_0043243333 /DNA_START=46 /DNA_END=1083 /DNA_ORIENTATION=-